MTTFTEQQINILRREFDGIRTMNPDKLPRLHAILDDCQDQALVQLANAGVKFVSKIARNDCVRRGLL